MPKTGSPRKGGVRYRYSGTFTWDLPVLANPHGHWTSFIDASGLELEYNTPEPAAWSMVAAGALWLWWRKRSARSAS